MLCTFTAAYCGEMFTQHHSVTAYRYLEQREILLFMNLMSYSTIFDLSQFSSCFICLLIILSVCALVDQRHLDWQNGNINIYSKKNVIYGVIFEVGWKVIIKSSLNNPGAVFITLFNS